MNNDLLGMIYASLYNGVEGATNPVMFSRHLHEFLEDVTNESMFMDRLSMSRFKEIPNIILDCEEDDLGALLYGIKFAGTRNIVIQRGNNEGYIDKAALIDPQKYYKTPLSKEYAKYDNIVKVWEKIAELFAREEKKPPPTVDNYRVGFEQTDMDNGEKVFKVIAKNIHKIIARIPDKTPNIDEIAREIINGTRMAATPQVVDVEVNVQSRGGKRRRTRRRKGRRSKKGVARKARKKTRRRRRRGKKSKKH